MEIPITLGILLTFFLPFLNAAIQKVTWSPTKKNLLAIATSALFAIAYLFLTGGIDPANIPLAIAACYGLQKAIYEFLVKNLATKFEAISSPGSVVVSASETSPGKVNITTDASIEASTDPVDVDPPVQVVTAPEEPAKPVEIIKDSPIG